MTDSNVDKSKVISKEEMIEAYKSAGPLLLHYKGGLYIINGSCLIHHPTEASKSGYSYLHLWPHAQSYHARGVDEFHSLTEDGQPKWNHLNPDLHPLPPPVNPRR